ncbi:hypothetical protein GCM10009551_048600 [Nocardiopsis tropica]
MSRPLDEATALREGAPACPARVRRRLPEQVDGGGCAAAGPPPDARPPDTAVPPPAPGAPASPGEAAP